jgi:hypothetical protein
VLLSMRKTVCVAIGAHCDNARGELGVLGGV